MLLGRRISWTKISELSNAANRVGEGLNFFIDLLNGLCWWTLQHSELEEEKLLISETLQLYLAALIQQSMMGQIFQDHHKHT